MNTPAQLHVASPRQMPTKLAPVEYPDRFEVRYVSANGGMRWRKQWVNITSALVGSTSDSRQSTMGCGTCTSGS